MKKLVSLVLALAMLMLAGVTTVLAEAAKEPVTLVWYFVGNGEQKDTQLVNDKINEMLKSVPGMEHVSIKLMPQISNEYNQKLLLARAAGEQVDLMHTYGMANPYDEIAKGNALVLDDLIAEFAPEILEEIPEWMMEFGRVDGKQYYIPGYQQASVKQRFGTPTEYLEKYGDAEALTAAFCEKDIALSDVAAMLEDYIMAIREGEGNEAIGANFVDLVRQGALGSKYDAVVGNTNTAFSYFVDTGKVSHIFLTEDMKEAFRISAEWYDKGLYNADVLTYAANDYTNKFGGPNMMTEQGMAWERNHNVFSNEDLAAIYGTRYGFDMTFLDMDPNFYITSRYAAGGTMVSSTCKNPEEAVRWLSLMNTKANGVEIYNTVVYGLEGVHYDRVDDTHITTREYAGSQGGADTSYAAMKWICGNTFNIWLNQGCTDGQNEYILNEGHSEESTKSPLIGFVAQSAEFQSEIDQINAIVTEYANALLHGVLGVEGWEEYYNEFVGKMNAAGAEKITAALQEQVDAFLAAK